MESANDAFGRSSVGLRLGSCLLCAEAVCPSPTVAFFSPAWVASGLPVVRPQPEMRRYGACEKLNAEYPTTSDCGTRVGPSTRALLLAIAIESLGPSVPPSACFRMGISVPTGTVTYSGVFVPARSAMPGGAGISLPLYRSLVGGRVQSAI
jgi:hypothetical protein